MARLPFVTTGSVMVALLGLITPTRARAEAPPLRLQAISQQIPGSCSSFPALDVHVEEEVKQLTGRTTTRVPTVPVNPTRTPAASFQLFGGYIEPLDNDAWRARLWLKDAGKSQVAVRDTYYRSFDRLTAELPADAAALILLPDWSRTATATPQYCQSALKSSYAEDACDAFLPPPSCGVPFDCTQSNQQPRCPSAPACGVAGQPPCAAAGACRVRDWRFGTGVAALVVGGVAVTVGGVLQLASRDGGTADTRFDAVPAAITSYVAGGALLGLGTGLVAHWALHAKTAACQKSN